MKPSDVTPEAVQALAHLRLAVRTGLGLDEHVRDAINALDNAGVFAVLDEAVDYTSAAEIMAEVAAQEVEEVMGTPDPAEWGDTTAADMARHQGYAAASGLGKLERVPGTDTLRPAHEHVFRSPHSEEICYGAEWCRVTFAEQRRLLDAAKQATGTKEVRFDHVADGVEGVLVYTVPADTVIREFHEEEDAEAASMEAGTYPPRFEPTPDTCPYTFAHTRHWCGYEGCRES